MVRIVIKPHTVKRGQKTKMDRTTASKCGAILKKLIAHPYGASFYKPADPGAFEIPEYLLVADKPMDLGTIRSKLAKDLYRTAGEFEADVRLTFSNAMEYNDVSEMARELDSLFGAWWNNEMEEVGKVVTRRACCDDAVGDSRRARKMDRKMVCGCVLILKRLMRKAGEGSELAKGLHRIRSDMVKDLYATPRAFEGDVKRMLSNAIKHNPSSSKIHNKAKKLDSVFATHWKALQRELETENSLH